MRTPDKKTNYSIQCEHMSGTYREDWQSGRASKLNIEQKKCKEEGRRKRKHFRQKEHGTLEEIF